MKKRFLAPLVAALLALPALALAETVGSLSGTITDETGAVLQGAKVDLSGRHLQGVRTVATDNLGKYVFRNLPPGDDYRITVSPKGFQTTTKEGIHVYLGREGTVNFTIKAKQMEETLTIVGEAPLVDVTRTTTGVNVTATQFESLPTTRNYQQLTTLAPGVTLEMGDHDTRFVTSPNVGASSAPENNYIIDGISATDPRYGTSGSNITMNFVQEVQVMTGGYNAEFGRSTGGVFNVVTKSGGNDFHGDVFGYYRNHNSSPENVVRRVNKELHTLFDGDDIYDLGFSLGGPIQKDKLWFFGAVDPTRRKTFIGGVIDEGGKKSESAGHDYTRDSFIYAGKLTWTLNPSHTLVATAFGDPTDSEGWLGDANSEPGAALRKSKTGGHNLVARYSGILSPKWLIEISAGRHTQQAELEAGSDVGRTVPRQIDETLGAFQRGGFQRVQKDDTSRDSFAVKMSNFVGSHDLRYGADVEINNYEADLQEQWFRYFGFSGSRGGDYIQERNYFVEGKGTTTNAALFLQDQWKVVSNLQLNLGIRYEEQWLDSANNVAVGAGYPEAEECNHDVTQCRTIDKLKLKSNWAPRVGIVWDPMTDGKAKVYGFFGRFYEAIPLNMNIRAINGERYIIHQWVNPTRRLDSSNWANPSGSPLAINGTWNRFRTSNLVFITPLDEKLKNQYQDEFVLGGEYQFAPQWSIGARFVDRELRRIIEDIGIFTNPDDPLELTGYVIGNPGEGAFGGPFEKPTRSYRALELTLQKARFNNWQLYSSFVFAKAKGKHEGLYMSGYDQLDPNITALYDIPSFVPNAEGSLRADKPFQFKVHSAYTFPFGLTVSEGFLLSAGIPISAQGPEIVNGYGDGTIFLKPRGSEGRTPTFWNLDLHADYDIYKRDSKRLSVVVDLFNVFNRHQTLEVDNDYVYEGQDTIDPWEAASNLDRFGNPKFNPSLPASPFYKTPILFQSPRAVQFGVKFAF